METAPQVHVTCELSCKRSWLSVNFHLVISSTANSEFHFSCPLHGMHACTSSRLCVAACIACICGGEHALILYLQRPWRYSLIFWIIFVPPLSILINFPAAIRCWTVSYWTSLMIILWSLLNNLSHDLWLFQGWKAFSCCCGVGPHHDSFMFSTGTGVSERKSKLSLRVMAVTVWGPWVSVHPWPFPYLIRGDHWHGQRIWCHGMRGRGDHWHGQRIWCHGMRGP